MELKKPLNYEQQIERLINFHKLDIKNTDNAINILKEVNYYRLSGYGIGLKKLTNSNEYIDGITFDDIYRLYCFDNLLKNKMIYLIEQIEIQFKSQIAYYFANKYGSEAYINPNNFISKVNKDDIEIHTLIMSSFVRECERQRNVPFVKHHIEQYDGHFPIWVAVELMTFGNLCSFFDIMKTEDRKEIAKLYNTKAEYLSSWILSIVEIRNICAHYGRLYNMPLKQRPYLYSEQRKFCHSKQNKLFPVFLTLKRILQDDIRWKRFILNISDLFEQYDDIIKLNFIDFPEDWKDILL